MQLREGSVPILVSRALPPPFGHAFTTRIGGVSTGICSSLNVANRDGDPRENVYENRRRACAAAEANGARLTSANQVMGAGVVRVTSDMIGNAAGPGRPIPRADALITNEPDVPLLTYSADCCLTLIADPVRRAVASVHASRAGAHAQILRAAVDAMAHEFQSAPADLIAIVGPTLCAKCHELDGAELDKWRGSPHLEGRHLDLESAVAAQLESAGVGTMDRSGRCTRCDGVHFFSHRRDGEATGRFGGLIWVRPL